MAASWFGVCCPAAVVVPIVLGVSRLLGERAGLNGMAVGVAIMIAANVLIVSYLDPALRQVARPP